MSIRAIEPTQTLIPDPLEIAAAKEALKKLHAMPKFKASSTFRLMTDEDGEAVLIPNAIMPLFIQLVSEMAEGNAVAVTALHEELSTQKSADILNVSRPFLIQLLENNEIPFHKVGTHRRVRLQDLLAYKHKVDSKRVSVLSELAEQAQKLEMGY